MPYLSTTDTNATSRLASGRMHPSLIFKSTFLDLRTNGPTLLMLRTVAIPVGWSTWYLKLSAVISAHLTEFVISTDLFGGTNSNCSACRSTTTTPLLITVSILKVPGWSISKISASLPGAIEPTWSSIWYASALFKVAIWMAVMGEIPALIANRTRWSTCPFSKISRAVMSSVQKLVWRATPGAPSVMALTFSAKNLVTEDSRIIVWIPFRAFSKNSSWE